MQVLFKDSSSLICCHCSSHFLTFSSSFKGIKFLNSSRNNNIIIFVIVIIIVVVIAIIIAVVVVIIIIIIFVFDEISRCYYIPSSSSQSLSWKQPCSTGAPQWSAVSGVVWGADFKLIEVQLRRLSPQNNMNNINNNNNINNYYAAMITSRFSLINIFSENS